MGSLSGGLATMCPGVPYALAAKFCHPDRPAIALVGDGAMQMLGINGLITIAERWQEWSDRLVIMALHNSDLNLVTWEQRAMAGLGPWHRNEARGSKRSGATPLAILVPPTEPCAPGSRRRIFDRIHLDHFPRVVTSCAKSMRCTAVLRAAYHTCRLQLQAFRR